MPMSSARSLSKFHLAWVLGPLRSVRRCLSKNLLMLVSSLAADTTSHRRPVRDFCSLFKNQHTDTSRAWRFAHLKVEWSVGVRRALRLRRTDPVQSIQAPPSFLTPEKAYVRTPRVVGGSRALSLDIFGHAVAICGTDTADVRREPHEHRSGTNSGRASWKLNAQRPCAITALSGSEERARLPSLKALAAATLSGMDEMLGGTREEAETQKAARP
ncbi:hypothetical protein L226DRAFT_525054 [Lentinus tigrinus ALCF2SS1-7]|uniref:uncharacterized protein n=1 Tax=Lentinus tigrinus ALCF2SS1-7 TaxID=1328758 RepID=UPI00116609E4|nr:hypothetical protein L226DRAFT_525054 [Lentinus tigrinus ALCF2SS1-7]